jgi:hypothetical protein
MRREELDNNKVMVAALMRLMRSFGRARVERSSSRKMAVSLISCYRNVFVKSSGIVTYKPKMFSMTGRKEKEGAEWQSQVPLLRRLHRSK